MKKFLTTIVAAFAATVAFAQPPMGMGGPGGPGGFGNFDPEQFQKMREEMMASAYKPSEAEKNAKQIVVSTAYSSAQEASDALIAILEGEGYTLLTKSKSRVYGYRNPMSRGNRGGEGGFPGGGFPGGGFPGGGFPGGGFPGGGMGGFPGGGFPGMAGGNSAIRPNEIDCKIKAKGGKVVMTFLMPKPVSEEENAQPNETGRIVKLIPDASIEIVPR